MPPLFAPLRLARSAIGLAILGALLPPAASAAQASTDLAPASVPAAMFVPGPHVPLSEFTNSANEPAGRVEVHVDPLILKWLQKTQAPLRLAARVGGAIQYLPAVRFDIVLGKVVVPTALVGDFVAVSPALVNDLPVVTHWSKQANGGRGGRVSGATDGIMRLDVLDPAVGFVLQGQPRIYNFDPAYADPADPTQPYYFRSNTYALFSDGTEALGLPGTPPSDEPTPAYERYIAENWSLVAPSDLAAIWLSDWCRGKWGLPIAHRNQPVALQGNFWGPGTVLENAPLLQIVHGHHVDTGDLDPNAVGTETSLATFLLPPLWRRAVGSSYPILFNGYYDLNAATFTVMGPVFLDRLAGEFVDHGRQAVGVLWNGGGSQVAYTFQRSAYDNAAQLFAEAQILIKGDRTRILSAGESRGGNTGLLMAANPHYPPHPTPEWPGGHPQGYRIRFVLADVPHPQLGENIELFSTATHPFVQGAMREATGYVRAWEPDWLHPVSGSGAKDLTRDVLFGTSDAALIDAELSPGSANVVALLAQRGTAVVLRAGTHDFSRPFHQVARFADDLRAANVPVRFEIQHRFGHELTVDKGETLAFYVAKLFAGDTTLTEETVHLRPDLSDTSLTVPFTPTVMPPILEAPLQVGWDQAFTLSLAGPPGAGYAVRACPAEPVTLNCLGGEPLVIASGVLAAHSQAATVGSAVHVLSFEALGVPMPSGVQTWRLELVYNLNGATVSSAVVGSLSQSLFGLDPLLPEMAVLQLYPSPVIGAHFGTRTGGLGADGQF